MKKNVEIEIKLGFENKQKVISEIKKVHGKYLGKYTLTDTYYGLHNSTMDNTQNTLLRIRQQKGKIELTCKGKVMSKDNIWRRLELNVKVDNAKAMENILLLSGFKKISENKSMREIWTANGCQLIFITFQKPSVLKLLEIESTTKSIVESTVKILGSTVSRFDNNSFTKFDNLNKLKQHARS
jgi:predicted adenylyl cyclase CyaB